jgi:type I restriction enzyme R subunit
VVDIDTAGRRFAVIVDEAHSSSAGETAQALRGILNKEGIEGAVAARILDDEDDSGLTPEARESMLRDMAKRPRRRAGRRLTVCVASSAMRTVA